MVVIQPNVGPDYGFRINSEKDYRQPEKGASVSDGNLPYVPVGDPWNESFMLSSMALPK